MPVAPGGSGDGHRDRACDIGRDGAEALVQRGAVRVAQPRDEVQLGVLRHARRTASGRRSGSARGALGKRLHARASSRARRPWSPAADRHRSLRPGARDRRRRAARRPGRCSRVGPSTAKELSTPGTCRRRRGRSRRRIPRPTVERTAYRTRRSDPVAARSACSAALVGRESEGADEHRRAHRERDDEHARGHRTGATGELTQGQHRQDAAAGTREPLARRARAARRRPARPARPRRATPSARRAPADR